MSELGGQHQWKIRRGVKELDILFERFVEHDYSRLTPLEQTAFIELLDQTDMQILDWLYQQQQPPEGELGTIIERLRNGTAITTE